jgi:hypothetical protein
MNKTTTASSALRRLVVKSRCRGCALLGCLLIVAAPAWSNPSWGEPDCHQWLHALLRARQENGGQMTEPLPRPRPRPTIAHIDIALFTDEYRLPLLPPDLAAYIAATIELSTPALLVLGLFTRAASAMLLAMTAVIEIFVYSQAWPTHIQWAAMLLVLLCRGPGSLSLNHWLWRRAAAASR